MLITLPGLNVRAPWAAKLCSGAKTIETRHYPLPKRYRDRLVFIIETGSGPARAIGCVRFWDVKLYASKSDWAADFRAHRIAPDDPIYGYDPLKSKWAWATDAGSSFLLREPWPVKKIGHRFTLAVSAPAHLIPATGRRETKT